MKCEYCGSEWNLCTVPYRDPEDGSLYDEAIPLCEGCVEHADDRSRARREWAHYHPGEPCPEIELPQPGPAPRMEQG